MEQSYYSLHLLDSDEHLDVVELSYIHSKRWLGKLDGKKKVVLGFFFSPFSLVNWPLLKLEQLKE